MKHSVRWSFVLAVLPRSMPSPRGATAWLRARGDAKAQRAFALGVISALAACASPPVARVSVAGPADGRLKLFEPLALTAVAEDGGGRPLPGQPLRWASSDEAIATVSDALVTARRLGNVTITAAAGGQAGSLDLATYGLEAVGGTLNQPEEAGGLGSVAFLRFRGRDGKAPAADLALRVAGPGGEGTAPQPYKAGAAWAFLPLPLAPRSGSHTASLTLGGEAYQTQFAVDAGRTLERPAVFLAVTGSRVDASWAPVPGAVTYFARVFYNADRTVVAERPATTGTFASFTNLTLDAGRDPYVVVEAVSADLLSEDVALPERFDVSSSVARVVLPKSGAAEPLRLPPPALAAR